MFSPGDPIEQRKRALIAKLSGRGQAGGGFRVGRPTGGGFGRGMGFGSQGQAGNRGQALAQMLSGYGGGPGNSEFGQGQQSAPQLEGPWNPGTNPVMPPQFFGQQPRTQPQIPPELLRQLLGSYGTQPSFSRPGVQEF